MRKTETYQPVSYTHLDVYKRQVVDCLEKAGIHGTVVGRTTGGNDRLLRNGQEVRYLDRPQADELYRALEV